MQINFLKNLSWLVPFLAFILGYQLLNHLYTVHKIPTPNLVGKKLTEAIKISSEHNLNLRILSEQIDQDLPENTILSQKPNHQNIRPNQAIFVVISKKPQSPIVPNLCGCNESELTTLLAKSKLKTKNYYLPSLLPKGLCICQTPSTNQELAQNKLITYLSSGSTKWMIMPNLTNHLLPEVKEFLDQHNLKINIKYLSDPKSLSNLVIEQQPAAGTIIDLDKLTQIDLCVGL